MGDYTIRMQFDIGADPATVREALTTTEGIAGWWSDAVQGNPQESGGQLLVRFPDLEQPFEFAVEHDADRISWKTGGFPPWWENTTIRWQLEPNADNGATVLRFSHTGFEPDDDIIPIITPAWANIIGRLKHCAETGSPDPFAVNP